MAFPEDSAEQRATSGELHRPPSWEGWRLQVKGVVVIFWCVGNKTASFTAGVYEVGDPPEDEGIRHGIHDGV